MKVFSVVMALVIAIFISGEASAASWEVVDNDNGIITSIDKDSIRRGTDSKKFPKFNRTDGFSAIVKLDVKLNGMDDVQMIYLASFYEKDGKRMYCLLDSDEKTNYPQKESDVLQENVDKDGTVWKKVWQYIETNIK